MPSSPATFPACRPATIAVANGGVFTPDSYDVTRLMLDRNAYNRERNVRVWAAWADGSSLANVAVNGLTVAGTYDLGLVPLTSTGTDSRFVNAAVHVSACTLEHVTYYAKIVILATSSSAETDWSPAYVLGTPVAAGFAAQWYANTSLPVPDDAALATARYAVRFYAVATAATAQTPDAVSVLSNPVAVSGSTGDGISCPNTWTDLGKLAAEAVGAEDRPDDGLLFWWLAKAQSHVAGRYAKAMGGHAFGPDTVSITAGKFATRSFYYRVPRGPAASSASFAADLTGTFTGTASATWGVYIGGALKNSGSVAAGRNIASATVASGDWTTNAVNEVEVRISVTGGTGVSTVRTHAIIVDEGAHTATGFVPTSGGRNEPIPQRWWPPSPTLARPGAPIVSAYARGSLLGRWTDRRALVHNAVWAANWTTQTLISDYLARVPAGSVEEGRNATSASYDTPDQLWEAQFTPRRGAARVAVWVLPAVAGADPAAFGRLALYKASAVATDASGAACVIHVEDNATSELAQWSRHGWRHLGTTTVTEGSAVKLEVYGGFVDGDEIGTTTTASLRLDGILAVELPAAEEPGACYEYLDSGTLSVAIPDNTPAGVTTTLTSTRSFTVRHVRVYVSTNHPRTADLSFKLTAPGGSAVTIKSGGVASGWYSDDCNTLSATGTGWTADASTDGPNTALAGVTGGTCAGTWTLTVIDSAAGQTGSITGFKLEIE